MIDDMGIFRTAIAVAHIARPHERRTLSGVRVDTGSEYNWAKGDKARLWEISLENYLGLTM